MTDAAPLPSCTPAVHYCVRAADMRAHRWAVEMTIAQPQEGQRVSLPVWVPGSYLVREFARHLDGLHAECGGQPCALQRINKNTWQAKCAAGQALRLRYEVYAFDASPRGAWLDTQRGFFNATALLLRAHGAECAPHTLHVLPPHDAPHWHMAVALAAAAESGGADERGFGCYAAPSYAALADAPVCMGPLWEGSFEAAGAAHRFVITGALPSFDGARLLRDAQKICQTVHHFWHPEGDPPPFQNYLFILHAGGTGGGGLEHANCCVLGCGRQYLPRLYAERDGAPSKNYLMLLGLMAHEYFHAWCVKRLHPFADYDFDAENLTELLWFFEGFTSYYEDIVLRRAGIIDDATYLARLAQHIERVRRTPGRLRQSLAQASYDAWLRFYRPDENTPNSTVDYYAKGALVALCFDLTLRAAGCGTLDEVMRALWRHCTRGEGGAAGGIVSEADIAAALHEVGARSFTPELDEWIHGTGELPLEPLLRQSGVRVRHAVVPVAHALGMRVHEEGGLIQVQGVLAGSAAAAAGLAAGDEWLAVQPPPAADGATAAAPDFWRLQRVKDVLQHARPQQRITLLIARDGRLLHLPLELPASGASDTVRWELEAACTDTPLWVAG